MNYQSKVDLAIVLAFLLVLLVSVAFVDAVSSQHCIVEVFSRSEYVLVKKDNQLYVKMEHEKGKHSFKNVFSTQYPDGTLVVKHYHLSCIYFLDQYEMTHADEFGGFQ
jgi:hypothetical protein